MFRMITVVMLMIAVSVVFASCKEKDYNNYLHAQAIDSSLKYTNIAIRFQATASSEYSNINNVFIASASNLNDMNFTNFWMNGSPGMGQWVELTLTGNAYVDSIKLYFVPIQVWGVKTNNSIVRSFRVRIFTDGEYRIITNINGNTVSEPVIKVGLSNISRIRVDLYMGDQEGYSRIRELAVYGSVTESSNFIYKYSMSPDEERLLVLSSDLFKKRNNPGSDYMKIMGEAIKANETIISNNPANPYAHMNLGQLYYELSIKTAETPETHYAYLEKAESELLAADTDRNPEKRALYDYLLAVYRSELMGGKYEAALSKVKELAQKSGDMSLYYRTLAMQPNDPFGQLNGAAVWDYIKRTGDSAGFADYLMRYTTYLVGNKNNRDIPKALEITRLLVNTFPNYEHVTDGSAYEYMAVCLTVQSNWQEAIEAWKKNFNYMPTKKGPLFISFAYLNMNDKEKMYENYLLFKLLENNAELIKSKKYLFTEVYNNKMNEYHVKDKDGVFINGSDAYNAYYDIVKYIIKNNIIYYKEGIIEDILKNIDGNLRYYSIIR